MKSLRALLICYYFPPLGGAGIGRPLSLFKYLKEFDIDCDVLTVKSVVYRVYEPEHLESLDISRIHRAGSFDPQRLMYKLGLRKIKGKTIDRSRELSERFFPDPKIGWVRPAERLGRQLLANQEYDVILSTSPPISCHLVARQLARESKIPWIADFRDFWTAYDIERSYSSLSKRSRAHRLLGSIRAESTLATAVNGSVADYLQTDNIIANSYDSKIGSAWRPQSEPDKFLIGLFGSFNELYPVEPLLVVMGKLIEQQPELRGKLGICQVGSVDEGWLNSQLNKYGLSDTCRMHGFLPRTEAIAVASAVSCFYISVPPSGAAHTTGKVFYMLASGRPILAAVPPASELFNLLTATGKNLVFDPSDHDQAVAFLFDLVLRHASGKNEFEVCPEYAQKYSSEMMVGKFAEIIRRTIPGK